MAEFRKILIANRGEIAIRVMRAANEMGKSTVAIFAKEDKASNQCEMKMSWNGTFDAPGTHC